MHAIVSVQDFKGLNTYVCMCAYEREREREYQDQLIIFRVTLDSPCPGDFFTQVKIRQLKVCENI